MKLKGQGFGFLGSETRRSAGTQSGEAAVNQAAGKQDLISGDLAISDVQTNLLYNRDQQVL